MRIAITGATGFIGSELVRKALERGNEVVAIVNPGSKRIGNIPDGAEIVRCDISNYNELMGKNRCDRFFHLAWDKTFGNDRDNVTLQIDNIKYCIDAVNLADSWGSKAFIGAGSQAEYGIATEPLNGDMKVDPQSGYGIAKYSAGRFSKLLCSQLGMRFNWARIISVYGPGDADHTLISYLIDTFLKGDVPELTKCEQKWDYIYSGDAAEALLRIGERGTDGRTYVIGSGECRLLKDYVIDIRNEIDPNLEIGFGRKDYYDHQPMFLCADISELTDDTGFVPKISFIDGVRKTIESRKGKPSKNGIR